MSIAKLAFDLCCGAGGWTHGLLAAGFRVIGFDIVRHPKYPVAEASLVLQDVRTLSGKQLQGASLIVASPPCLEFTRLDLPWTRRSNPPPPDLSLALAVQRLREESGVPTVVENVRGSRPYFSPIFGPSRKIGPVVLYGDFPALMHRSYDYRHKESMSHNPGRRSVIPLSLAKWVAECFAA